MNEHELTLYNMLCECGADVFELVCVVNDPLERGKFFLQCKQCHKFIYQVKLKKDLCKKCVFIIKTNGEKKND